MDSNQRRPTPTGLQPVPFSHSGTPPGILSTRRPPRARRQTENPENVEKQTLINYLKTAETSARVHPGEPFATETLADLEITFILMTIMAKRKHPSRPSKRRPGRPNPKEAPRRAKHESAFASDDHGAAATAQGGGGGGNGSKRPGRPPPGRARKTNWIYGFHAVLAALANPERVCHRLLVNATAAEDLKAAVAKALDTVSGRRQPEAVERAEIEKALPPGAVHQGLALLTEPLPAVAIEDVVKAPLDSLPDSPGADNATVVVLDQATDPRNVGAVLRSADAFEVAAVVVQDRHAPPMTGALCKAASGAAERVPMVRVKNIARAIWTLKDAGFWCAGLDPEAERTLAQAGFSGRVALVLGAEGRGLRPLTRKTCDELVRIPAAAGTESLNLSNAAAIALYELRRERT